MNVVGVATFILATAFTLVWAWGIRSNVRRGIGITWATATIVELWVLSLVAVAATRLSSFHLLWMFPASLVVGMLSIMPGLRLLWLPARALVAVCTLGLNTEEVSRNTARVERCRVLTTQGMKPEEAAQQASAEFPEGAA